MALWLTRLFLFLVALPFLLGCAAPVYRVPAGRTVVVQFLEDEEQVSRAYFAFRPADRQKYKQIRGFYMEGFHTVVVAANPCDPEVLAHELLHFLGQHWVDY